MERSYLVDKATLAVSTSIEITIPANVEVIGVKVYQATTRAFSINANVSGGATDGVIHSQGTSDLAPTSGASYHKFNLFCDIIKIENNSGSNALNYWIYGKEQLK
jgi:hypothetical protein